MNAVRITVCNFSCRRNTSASYFGSKNVNLMISLRYFRKHQDYTQWIVFHGSVDLFANGVILSSFYSIGEGNCLEIYGNAYLDLTFVLK